MTENEGQSSSRSVAKTVWNPGLDSSNNNKNSSPIVQSSSTAPQLLPFPPPFALLAAAAHFRQQHQQNLNQRCQQQNAMPKMHIPSPPPTSASFPPFTFPPPAFRLPPPPFPFMFPPPPPPPQIPSPHFGQMAAAFMANLAANRQQQQQQQMEMMNGGNGNNNGSKRRKKERAKWPILDNGSQSIENGQIANGMSSKKSGEMNALKRNKRKGREIIAGGEEFLYGEEEEKDGLPSSTTLVANNNNKRSRQNNATNPIVELVLNEKPAGVNFNTCAICGISFRVTTELVAHVRSNHRHTSRYDRQQRTSIGEAQMKEKLTMVKDEQRREEWTVDEAEIQNNLQNNDI